MENALDMIEVRNHLDRIYAQAARDAARNYPPGEVCDAVAARIAKLTTDQYLDGLLTAHEADQPAAKPLQTTGQRIDAAGKPDTSFSAPTWAPDTDFDLGDDQ